MEKNLYFRCTDVSNNRVIYTVFKQLECALQMAKWNTKLKSDKPVIYPSPENQIT
jgi:hypothetical protein